MREYRLTIIPREKGGSSLSVDGRTLIFDSSLKLNEDFFEQERNIIEKEVRRLGDNFRVINPNLVYFIEVRVLDKISGTWIEVYSFNTKYNRFVKHN
jgi:hypothetical protein